MRVTLVCGTFRPSRDGVAHYVARLAAALRAAAVDVVVAGGDGGAAGGGDGEAAGNGDGEAVGDGGVDDGGGAAGAAVVTGRWDAAGSARAGRALARLGADVVHVQWAPTAYGPDRDVTALLPALGGARLVTTLHEYDGPTDAEAATLAAASRHVVVTNAAHGARLAPRLPSTPVVHVPIGANLDAGGSPGTGVRDAVRAALRRSLGAPTDASVVAFFGFVHPVKGIRYLLPAVARLRVTRPDLRLVLAGGFESLALPTDEAAAWRAEVEELVAHEGLEGAVRITGFLPDREVSPLLAAADVGVLPFTAGTTTKSGSLLALAAHGVPVVATAADPADPALRDGEEALLVPTRDADAIAAGLDRVLADAGLAGRLRAGGQRLVAARSWDAIAAAHIALYQEVLR